MAGWLASKDADPLGEEFYEEIVFGFFALCTTAGLAMPIASSARSMVPAEIQQLIGVDYRALKDSPTAQQLKDQVLPPDLKNFEASLKGIGIDSDHDLDQLNFVSFRTRSLACKSCAWRRDRFRQRLS